MDRWPSALLDLVFPTDCGGCARPGPLWCPTCAATVGPPRRAHLDGPGPPVTAAGRYTGSLRTALLAHKERGRRDLGPVLARLLHPTLAAAVDEGPVVLVPAPMRRAAVRARGGDHLWRWCARLAADRSGTSVAAPLRLAGRVRDSVGLDPRTRAANLAGAVVVARRALPARGASVVLVDDVVTTGATVRAAAAALNGAGVHVLAAIALCDATGGSIRRKSPEKG